MKPVLVGELNPYGGDDYYALYPAPDGCSGHRLCQLVLGMHRSVYLETFERVNLCRGKWSVKDARIAAKRLTDAGRYCVLLGKKVSTAFDTPFDVFEAQFLDAKDGHGGLLVLPHPSGLCRMWNEPDAFVKARAAVAAFCPKIAHLLGVL